MYLSFLGSGSALNTALGNNSAFIQKGESILLIDCGSTTFSRLQGLNLLENTKNINVLITHRHPDHIASLGDLIFFAYYILKAEISVITPDGENVAELLKLMGVQKSIYKLISLNDKFELKNQDFSISIDYVKVKHVEEMDCYGYILKYQDTAIYYSGDAMTIPDNVLQLFEDSRISYIYQDICSYDYPENPHMFINKLVELISDKDRNRVFCMHFDESFDNEKVQQLGFRLVESTRK